MLEKNNSFSSFRVDKKRAYKILPSTIEMAVKASAIIPFVSKSKTKPLSVAFIPDKIEPPSTNDGIVTSKNSARSIFVDFFILVLFAKRENVFIIE